MKYIGKKNSTDPVSPFNVYAGTVQLNQTVINGDVYMMDEADGTIVYVENDGTIEYSYEKGKNHIGETGNSKVVKWATDTITGTELDSYGGSIYCNGDLELGAVQVAGDVRVAGNCEITGEVDTYIGGDLIVGGDLSVENEDKLHISGNIYCDGAVTGWGELSSELLPGVVQVPNFEHITAVYSDYYEYNTTENMSDWSGKKGYFGENIGFITPVYYRYSNIERDDTGAIISYEVDSSTAPLSSFDSMPAYDVAYWTQGALLDDGTVIDTGEPLEHPTDCEYSYYKNGSWIPATQAYGAEGISHTSAIVASVYPTNMTREAIYGSYNDAGEFIAAPSTTKIVTTLEDVQSDVGFDADIGEFDPVKYPTSLPSAQQAVWNDTDRKSQCIWKGETTINPSATPEYADNQLLIFDGSSNASFNGENIEITPVSDMYIVLDGSTNGSLNIGMNTNIIIDDFPGVNVYFLIKGDVRFINSTITTKSIYDKTEGGKGGTISQSDTTGIIYYADESTSPSLRFENSCTFVGDAYAPSLKLIGTTGVGRYQDITYEDSSGNILGTSLNPHWIGNGIFKSIDGFNNFTFLSAQMSENYGGYVVGIVDSGTCGENLTWVLYEDGTLVISGEGEMDNWILIVPWYDNKDEIKKVIIDTGVTSIGPYAFIGCNSLENITIPNSLKSIGEWAFAECSSIKSIVIANSVTSIGKVAFISCINLADITIPSSVTSIESEAFKYCKNLESITIGHL